jgi:fumarate hydratase class II
MPRTETDSFGPIQVPDDRYWGAQTQRSLENFRIGGHRFTRPVIAAFGVVKQAAAIANEKLGVLDAAKRDLIVTAANEVASGKLDDHFPLVVWQTGSGTQSNMNANEVIANRAIELAGGKLGSQKPIHPNDDVNRSQSSNDVFPTVMHVATAMEIEQTLLPSVARLRTTLDGKARDFADVVKIGRTHMMDATPLTLGQEISGWAAQLAMAETALGLARDQLLPLALGGTAVGTGLNAPPGFDGVACAEIARMTGLAFRPAANKFAALAGHEAMAFASSAVRTLAVACLKIGGDVRLLTSGPRCGIGEIRIPENEPGSSIMPGKINPTQAEALTMVSVQVIGLDAAVGFASSMGPLELNVFKPIIVFDVLEAIRLLADACESFREHCAVGIEPRRDVIKRHLDASLMLVTALTPHIGYDRAAKIAKHAHEHGLTLRDAAVALGAMTAEEFDARVDPAKMIG